MMTDTRRSRTNEPAPQPGDREVAPFVVRCIQERVEMGKGKYGTTLQAHNGRDALWDAMQEAIDTVMYIGQALLERDA